jgi:hypothetical protein
MGDFDQISMRYHCITALEGGVPGDSVVGDRMAMNGASWWWTTFGHGAMVISHNLLCSVFFYAAMSVVNHKPP